MAVFELVSENLTGLGGPMGTERTWDNWRKFFHSIKSAKHYAEKDYRRGGLNEEKLEWKRLGNRWSTQDLRFVMYHIKRVKVAK